MTCEETKHLLFDAALGEEADRARLAEHLASCPACRAEFRDLELTRKLLLQGLPEEEPPRRIAFVAESPRRPAGFWQWAFAASAALALLFAVLAIRRPAQPGAIADSRFKIQDTAPSSASALALQAPRASDSPAATFTRAEVEKLVAEAVRQSEQRQRAETLALVTAASRHMADQMRYFERTQSIFYKQAEQNRSDLQYIANLMGRGGPPSRQGGGPIR